MKGHSQNSNTVIIIILIVTRRSCQLHCILGKIRDVTNKYIFNAFESVEKASPVTFIDPKNPEEMGNKSRYKIDINIVFTSEHRPIVR